MKLNSRIIDYRVLLFIFLSISSCAQKKELSIAQMADQAIAAMEKDDYKKALRLYQNIKSSDSTFQSIDLMIGMCYYILNSKDLAFDFLTKAYNKDSSDVNPLYLRGLIYFEREQFNESINDLVKFTTSSQNPHAYYILGKSYLNIYQLDKALLNLNLAIEQNDSDSDWFQTRAAIYILLQEYNNAISDCNRAIDINDKASELYIMRAMIYDSINDKNKACDDYRKAKTLGFNNKNHPLIKICE